MRWASSLSLLTISPDKLSPPWSPCPYLHANWTCIVKTSPRCLFSKVLQLHLGSPQLQGWLSNHLKSDSLRRKGGFLLQFGTHDSTLSAQCLAATSLGWLTLWSEVSKTPKPFSQELSDSSSDHSSPRCVQFIFLKIAFALNYKSKNAWCSKLGKHRGKLITGNDYF